MTRGAIRPTTREEAVRRVLSMVTAIPVPPPGAPPDAGHRPIAYRLEDFNGGEDPFAEHCADWSYGLRTPTADCIGLVLWGSGVDRDQPSYQGTRGPWLNGASLLNDADGAKLWCTPIPYAQALPGDWLVTPDHAGRDEVLDKGLAYVRGSRETDRDFGRRSYQVIRPRGGSSNASGWFS